MSVKQSARELLLAKGPVKDDVVAVVADGKIVDLMTPIEPPAKLEALRANDPRALEVIRHSTAHVMADAVQKLFPGTQVTIGPSIDNGFYYDFFRPDSKTFSEDDLRAIEARMGEIIAGAHPFRREPVARDEAKKLFDSMGERFKLEIIDKIPEGEEVSLYRHNDWVDVCRGPHVPNTKFLQAVKLTGVAGAYWRGDERNPMLQRIYGTAFADKKSLDAYLKQLEEARARDHRVLGKKLGLFMFSDLAPASPFFLPRGAFVYHRLIDFIRSEYAKRGYEEVITPQVFDKKLWETSGHWENYRELMLMALGADAMGDGENSRGVPVSDVFSTGELKDKDSVAALAKVKFDAVSGCKAMNCPSHCVIFGSQRRSYRELPWRVADFGRLHRYERSGVTHGLMRVRTFCQDDAHIFCTPEQAQEEIGSFVDFFFAVYAALGFDKIEIRLATRPEKRLGDDALWDRAESLLSAALNERGFAFVVSEGEGAFYGPKLEFHVTDAIGRPWQLGTIQLDYNLPDRFELEYVGADNAAHRPVMLHRAIFGSIERFLGVYIEHVNGAFPMWLAPEQLVLLTVADKHAEYAHEVARAYRDQGLRVIVDDSNEKIGAKVRSAAVTKYPYRAVVGDKEVADRSLALTPYGSKDSTTMSLDDALAKLLREAAPPVLARATRRPSALAGESEGAPEAPSP